MISRRLVHVVTVPATLSLMRGQLEFCAASGFDVHVAASFGANPLPQPGATLHSVPMTRSFSPAADLVSVSRLVHLFNRLKPTIVQAGTPKAALVGMIAARVANVRTRIYHIRGLDHLAGTRGRALAAEAAERACCSLATNVLCVSDSVRENLISSGIVSPDKVTVLLRGSSNGVDAAGRFDPLKHRAGRIQLREALGLPRDSLVIGFVGRLVRDKGIETLFQAWQKLREDFPTAHLLLVGPFESGDALRPNVRRELEADPRIHVTSTDWGQAAPLYAAMDVVGFPSLREGFPNVPLEAAAMGLPVIAARVVGSVNAIVHGVTGILVEPRDPTALSQALGAVLRDPNLARRLGAAARARVLEDYRPADLWAAQVEWYRRLINE